MAKLYAELSSDKGGRVVGKGGNELLTVIFKDGNKQTFTVQHNDYLLEVYDMNKGSMLFRAYYK